MLPLISLGPPAFSRSPELCFDVCGQTPTRERAGTRLGRSLCGLASIRFMWKRSHPCSIAARCWRRGSLATLLWVHRWIGDRPELAWTGASVGFFLGLLCKKSAATLPVLIVGMLLATNAALPARALWRKCAPVLTMAAPLGPYAWMRAKALA